MELKDNSSFSNTFRGEGFEMEVMEVVYLHITSRKTGKKRKLNIFIHLEVKPKSTFTRQSFN